MTLSVIVTGAARGIGLAILRRLAADGWVAVGFDVDPGIELVASSVGAIGVRGDVRSFTDLSGAVIRAENQAPLAALVNNAAIVDMPRRGFEEIPEEEWDRVMSVNVGGVWKATRAAAPGMRRHGSGSIVNISSDTVLSGVPGLCHYLASKGAIMSMTRALASELGPDHIRVNSLAIGFTETEAALAHGDDAATRAVERRAIGRRQLAEDAVGTISWLVSADAEFVTGQMIVVNGGYVFH